MNNKNKATRLFLMIVLASLPIINAHSQVFVANNLSETTDGAAAVTGPGFPFGSTSLGNQFTTDAQTYNLSSIQVSLGTPLDTSSSLSVQLWSNTSGTPGASIATLTGNPSPGTAGTFTYTPSGSVTLDANTAYWVVLSVPSGSGTYVWNTTFSTASSGSGTIGANVFTSANGGTWSSGTGTAQFAVSATPVPEPAAYAVVAGVGLLGFAVWRQLGKKQQRAV